MSQLKDNSISILPKTQTFSHNNILALAKYVQDETDNKSPFQVKYSKALHIISYVILFLWLILLFSKVELNNVTWYLSLILVLIYIIVTIVPDQLINIKIRNDNYQYSQFKLDIPDTNLSCFAREKLKYKKTITYDNYILAMRQNKEVLILGVVLDGKLINITNANYGIAFADLINFVDKQELADHFKNKLYFSKNDKNDSYELIGDDITLYDDNNQIKISTNS